MYTNNEAREVFYQDCREKKAIAHSAAHRVRNARSGCRLPTRSTSEVQAMQGTSTYKLNAAYTWGQFIDMPQDIQVEYLRHLSSKYHIEEKHLTELFFKDPREIHAYLQSNVLTGLLRGSNGQFDCAAWAEFLTHRVEDAVRTESPATIGEQIKAARDERKMSQRALSKAIGLSQPQVCMAENGRLSISAEKKILDKVQELPVQDTSPEKPVTEVSKPAKVGKGGRKKASCTALETKMEFSGNASEVLSLLEKVLSDGTNVKVQVTLLK